MKPTFLSEDLPDGSRVETEDLPSGERIVRHFQDGRLISEFHFQTLGSGKRVHREFDGSHGLNRAIQSYGSLDIGIHCQFVEGEKASEMYFVRRELTSRRSYEKARLKYNDMPPADETLQDFGARLLKGAAAERKASAAAMRHHVADSGRGKRNDIFCSNLMTKGTCEDALIWLENRNHTLGEIGHAASCQLVKKLLGTGALRIFACEIDDYGDEGQNTGHLVVELPKDKELRPKLFKALARLAEKQGFTGDLDDGQDYAYVKLD